MTLLFTEMDPVWKGTWKLLTPNQTQTLIEWFQVKPYLKKKEKRQLATSLNISEGRIQRWFTNKRHATRSAGLILKGEEC